MALSPEAAQRGAAAVFSLFRSILRLHRQRLPPPMRAMGNEFARSEFRRHLQSNTTDEQWRAFMVEWQRYTAMLGGTADQQAAMAAPAPAAGAAAGGSCGGHQAELAEQAERDQRLSSMTAAIASGSADMTEQLLEQLSPDQRRRLVKLQQEALALGAQMLGREPLPPPTPEGEGEQQGGRG